MNVSAIFPTPVGLDKIDTLTEVEIKHILDYKNKTTKNFGNRITSNNYVLEDENLNGLKSSLENKLQEYFFDVYKTNEAIPYITQSWINFTDQNEFHHNHKHPNSFISGVFYLQSTENDRIVFTSNHDNMFEYQSED